MKRILPVILIACLLLCACEKAPVEQTTNAPVNTTAENVTTEQTIETTEATEATTEQTTVPDATEETAAPIVYHNPLNGMQVDELYVARPYAVVINNIKYAQPVCGVGSADFVIEGLTEGGITRCLAVFSDIGHLKHIGAIRSARPFLVDIACSFDAIFIHHGGSKDGYSLIKTLGMDDMDAIGRGAAAFYRDQERLDNGYDLEHTSFADGDKLMNEIAALSYATERADGVDYGFAFDAVSSAAAGQNASELKVSYVNGGKTTTFTYNAQRGRYEAEQYGADVVDGNTGETIPFRNVIAMNVETEYYQLDQDETVRVRITLTGEGTGSYACDGKMIPIRWSRAGDTEPFVFTHEDGTPITLGEGNTYIALVPSDGLLEVKE